MARNFASIGFSAAAKEMQEKFGSRKSYARMEKDVYVDGFTENEMDFIAERDSFYLASMGENGFPYIQHRGGPKGFLKVLDNQRLGFIDFSGNKQYITVGNLATNNKVCLIMVDYPTRARLKIYATAEMVELNNHSELHALLDLPNYAFRPERMMVLHVEAYDWNCPQHIVPRYTIDEIEKALAPQRAHIEKLEAEIMALKSMKNNQ